MYVPITSNKLTQIFHALCILIRSTTYSSYIIKVLNKTVRIYIYILFQNLHTPNTPTLLLLNPKTCHFNLGRLRSNVPCSMHPTTCKHYLRFLHHQGTQQKCRNKYTYHSRGFIYLRSHTVFSNFSAQKPVTRVGRIINSLVICSAVPSNQQPQHNLMHVEYGFLSGELHQVHAQPISAPPLLNVTTSVELSLPTVFFSFSFHWPVGTERSKSSMDSPLHQ